MDLVRISGVDYLQLIAFTEDFDLDFQIRALSLNDSVTINLSQINECDIDSNDIRLNSNFEDTISLDVAKNQGRVSLVTESVAYSFFTKSDSNRCGIDSVEYKFSNGSVITDGTKLYDLLGLGSASDNSISIDTDLELTDGFVSNFFYDVTYEATTAGGNVISKDINIRLVICENEVISLVNATDKVYELWLDQPTAETITEPALEWFESNDPYCPPIRVVI